MKEHTGDEAGAGNGVDPDALSIECRRDGAAGEVVLAGALDLVGGDAVDGAGKRPMVPPTVPTNIPTTTHQPAVPETPASATGTTPDNPATHPGISADTVTTAEAADTRADRTAALSATTTGQPPKPSAPPLPADAYDIDQFDLQQPDDIDAALRSLLSTTGV